MSFLRQFVSLEEAEDLASEALFRVAQTKTRGNRFDSARGTFAVWVFRIAGNLRTNRLRRRRLPAQAEPASGGSETTLAEQVPSREPAPEEEAMAREVAAVVEQCLAELSEAHREVLLLDMDGRSLAEIAATLGIPPGTAGSRLHYARQRMRECLAARGYRLD